MITKLKIANFKSHKNTELNTGNLTVLTGINSSGKSSVLQSLLLLRQSFKKGRLSNGLDLNEPLCEIGFGEDAISRFATKNRITFTLEGENNESYDFQFNVEDRLEDTHLPRIGSKVIGLSKHSLRMLFSNEFQYISSSRWANINSYPPDSYAVKAEKQLSLKNGQGELVAHFLNYYGESKNFSITSDLLLHPKNPSRNLLEQVIEWEREISPRIGIIAKPIASGEFEIKYEYEGGGNNEPIKNIKTKNVGFGISYSLPVVVALLSAKPGTLLIIENPEAHLHPRGQSKLAELMALVAQTGVQIFVETHSDHIFNGLRKAISQKRIDKDKVKVHFFELNDENISVQTEIHFSDNGRILNSINGLFDQFDNDLDELLGL